MKNSYPLKLELFICIVVFFGTLAIRAAGVDSEKGYGGIPWGITYKQFQSEKESKPLGLMDKVRARAIDYLMMDFHEVAFDDPSRPPKFSVQEIKGDDVAYVFYDGKYCLASVPIDENNLEAVQKKLEKEYKRLNSRTYQSYLEFEGGDYGWDMLHLDYVEYRKTSTTTVYFIKAFTHFEELSGSYKPIGGFLIYVPSDYFKKTAYMDWLANKSMAPEVEKKKAEQRAKTDLGRVE